MARLINFSDSAHWYDKERNPQHDADLRIARKAGLYPSVTTIDKGVFKNDFLDRWKMDQLVLAAGENMRMPHENPKQYAQRIYELSMLKASNASEFGTIMHKALEDHPNPPADIRVLTQFNNYDKWWKSHNLASVASEFVLLDHDIGVAGTCDRVASRPNGAIVIPDYKTQDVKIDDKGRKKPAFYDSFPRQLAFYAVAHAKISLLYPVIPECVSVVIDSNPEGEVYEKWWTEEEIMEAYHEFVVGAYQWFKKREYWPVGKWHVSPSVPMPGLSLLPNGHQIQGTN